MARFRHARIAAALLVSAIGLAAAPAFAGSCIDWQRAVGESDLARHPGATTVLVQPFTDFTKQPGDDWLVLGLRDYTADLLRTSKGLRVLAGPSALISRDATPPTFLIGGMFQRHEDAMRVFLQLSDGRSGKLLQQQERSFPYPDNQGFFREIAEAVKAFMAAMHARPEGQAFSALRDATPSTRSYESFARGRQRLEGGKVDAMAAAIPHFEDAKRLDYRSPLGYEGLIAVHALQGLNRKQRGEEFAGDYQKAQSEYLRMRREARPASLVFGSSELLSKRATGPQAFGDRFLAGNAAYLEGIASAQAGEWEAAAKALRRAVAFVPEDALAWFHLSRMEEKLGDASKGAEARAKALAINPCIEK